MNKIVLSNNAFCNFLRTVIFHQILIMHRQGAKAISCYLLRGSISVYPQRKFSNRDKLSGADDHEKIQALLENDHNILQTVALCESNSKTETDLSWCSKLSKQFGDLNVNLCC